MNIGPNLADDIPTATRCFKSCVPKTNETIKSKSITTYDFRDTFSFLKINESAGDNKTSFNVLKNCFGELCDPLKYVFNLSFKKAIFPDYMKFAKHLYWNHTSAWVLSCNFAAYFQNTFS